MLPTRKLQCEQTNFQRKTNELPAPFSATHQQHFHRNLHGCRKFNPWPDGLPSCCGLVRVIPFIFFPETATCWRQVIGSTPSPGRLTQPHHAGQTGSLPTRRRPDRRTRARCRAVPPCSSGQISRLLPRRFLSHLLPTPRLIPNPGTSPPRTPDQTLPPAHSRSRSSRAIRSLFFPARPPARGRARNRARNLTSQPPGVS